MYDIKPVVFKLLKEIKEVKQVTDAYPSDWTNLPCISFYEQNNSDYLKKGREYLTEIVIQVDVWNSRSTGSIANKVNDKMNAIGFVREFSRDIPDPNIKHKSMRFKGIIDVKKLLVYQ